MPVVLLIGITDVLNVISHDFLRKAMDDVPKHLQKYTDNVGTYVESKAESFNANKYS